MYLYVSFQIRGFFLLKFLVVLSRKNLILTTAFICLSNQDMSCTQRAACTKFVKKGKK